MIDEILERNRELIRRSLKEVEAQKIEIQNSNVSDALDHFERANDLANIRSQLKKRGAIGIRKKEGEAGYETYTKQRTAEMIESGEYEVISGGLGRKIALARANLFNNPTQSFSYFSGEMDEAGKPVPDDEIAANVNAHRKAGGCDSALVDGNYVASAVDSGPVFVQPQGGVLRYDAFSPANLYFKFHDSITDNGSSRGVDYADVEDCTAMVIQLSAVASDIDQTSYLAVMGRNDDPGYPLGRYVFFTARNWWDIPDPGDPNANDWVTNSGEIANPLSLYAEQTGSASAVEYPIIILKGGLSITNLTTPAPTSTSLYETTLEIDVALSRLMKDSLSSALGTKVITSPKGGEVPRCLEGAVMLYSDQTFEIHSVPIANAQGAMEIVKTESRMIADGFSVPGYQIMAGDTQVESGVALYIRTKPLEQEWARSAQINGPEIQRLFEIEKGLHAIHYPEKQFVPEGTTQVWNPGRFIYPESEKEKAERLKAALDAKFISYVRSVRDYHNFATDRQAIEYIQLMEEQNAENPPPTGGQQQSGFTMPGMASRFTRPQ